MANPSSAAQWILDSPQQITIYLPRDYSSIFSLIGLFAAAMLAIVLVALLIKGARNLLWMVPIVLLFGFFVTYLRRSDTGTAVASKADGTLRITNNRGVTDTYPLQSVQKMVVETQDGNSRRMIFVLSTGQNVPLGMWATRDGMYQAAEAFNRFLTDNSSTVVQPASTNPNASATQ